MSRVLLERSLPSLLLLLGSLKKKRPPSRLLLYLLLLPTSSRLPSRLQSSPRRLPPWWCRLGPLSVVSRSWLHDGGATAERWGDVNQEG